MSEERSIYYVLTTYDKCKPVELVRAGDTGHYEHEYSEQSKRLEYINRDEAVKDLIDVYKENIRRLELGWHPENLIEPHFQTRCYQDDYEYTDNCG
jgi:hypothetical protein